MTTPRGICRLGLLDGDSPPLASDSRPRDGPTGDGGVLVVMVMAGVGRLLAVDPKMRSLDLTHNLPLSKRRQFF